LATVSQMAAGDSVLIGLVEEALSMHVDSEWHEAKLYTPFFKDQAQLYEFADCLAVQTFLRMAQLPIQNKQRPNTEFISPTGEVPVLQIGSVLIPGFTGIVDLVRKKEAGLSSHLTDVQKADMAAQIAVIDNILRKVEMYIVWVHEETYSMVTSTRFGSVYKWPLSRVLPALKRREMRDKLGSIQWANKTLVDVMEAADKAFRCLSSHLATQDFVMGSRVTEADALLFGHLFAILTTRLPTMELSNALRKYPNLVEYTERIENEYFKK
ncbi:hypothetical protein PMAYCL1PPCAC_12199, partial [Pristionchus mayeri]